MNQEQEEVDEIKKAIRHLDIQAEDFSPKMIEEWEKEYDTMLDITNLAVFIWDTIPYPIKYLYNIKCIKLPRIQELKQESINLLCVPPSSRGKK